MIAITGASGQLGRLVIESLLNKTEANNIIAIMRNPKNATDFEALGIQVRIADYDQPESFTAALKGVDRLLLISASDVGQRAPQHQVVIDAAKAEGVRLFAYTSLLKTEDSPLILAQEHKVTEAAIKSSGLPAVILRNGWYTENFLGSIKGTLEAGKVVGASAQGRWNTASRKDYAEAAAEVLTSSENQTGKVYELAGDESYDLADYAAEISKQSGKEITYQDLKEDAYSKFLVDIGLPEGFATILADAQKNAAKGWLGENSGSLSKLIGHPTTSLKDSIAAAL